MFQQRTIKNLKSAFELTCKYRGFEITHEQCSRILSQLENDPVQKA